MEIVIIYQNLKFLTYHKICNFTKFNYFSPHGGRFKTDVFGFFSKLKKDINKRFAPADYPIVASKNMPYSTLHQFDVECKKIIGKLEVVKIY